MKSVLISISIILITCHVKAQGIGGFFTQQENKIKIMIEQVAEYETSLKELKNGYATTQHGLSTIHDLKNGTYALHAGYISSLSQVAPAVRNNPKIKGTADLVQQIISTFDRAVSWQNDKAVLTSDELADMKNIYSHLLHECNKDLDELSLVTTNGEMQMTDEERIHRIDSIYADMQSKYKFSCSFTANAYALANNRIKDNSNRQALKKLYNIN